MTSAGGWGGQRRIQEEVAFDSVIRTAANSPESAGRRQGLSTPTALGVSPQLGRVTLSVLRGVRVLITSAATGSRRDS